MHGIVVIPAFNYLSLYGKVFGPKYCGQGVSFQPQKILQIMFRKLFFIFSEIISILTGHMNISIIYFFYLSSDRKGWGAQCPGLSRERNALD